MNYSNYRFNLDVQSTVSQVSLPVRLLDTGRRLYIGLTDGGSPYIIEDGCSAVFYARKADGNPVMNYCMIERNTIIRYDLTEQTTSCPGIVDCEIRVYDTEHRLITSPRFILVVNERVVHDADFPISEAERSLLDSIIATETERAGAETERVEAEKRREAAMVELEARSDAAIDAAEQAVRDAETAVATVNMTEITNRVLDVLPTWKGGSY